MYDGDAMNVKSYVLLLANLGVAISLLFILASMLMSGSSHAVMLYEDSDVVIVSEVIMLSVIVVLDVYAVVRLLVITRRSLL